MVETPIGYLYHGLDIFVHGFNVTTTIKPQQRSELDNFSENFVFGLKTRHTMCLFQKEFTHISRLFL